MKYGIYKAKHGTKILVSRDFFEKMNYYVTYLRSHVTIQHRGTQKDFAKWLKKMKFKYIGGVV